MQFILKKDEINRLKVFNSYLKSCNNTAALKTEQLFVIDNNKLSVYGNGASGHITADFDIESNDSFKFTIDFSKFLNYLEKVNSDVNTISYANSKLVFTGDQTTAKYSQVCLNTIEEEAADDMKAISEFETSNAFTGATTISLTDDLKNTISYMCSMAGLLNCNKFVKLSDEGVTSVDNTSIITKKIQTGANGKDFYLLRTISPLLKDAREFKICNFESSLDNSINPYVYINIDSLGIKMWFNEPEVDFQIPSEEEIAAMSAPADTESELTIKTADFYEAIEKFEGVFDADSWKYKQLKISFDPEDKSKVLLHYDNMVSEVSADLPIVSVDKDHIIDGLFLFPTLHMKFLKEDLLKEETFKFSFDFDNDAHIIIHIKNSFMDVALTKVDA